MKISENLTGLWCFQGVDKRCIGYEWVNVFVNIFYITALFRYPLKTSENLTTGSIRKPEHFWCIQGVCNWKRPMPCIKKIWLRNIIHNPHNGPSIKYVRKIFRKTNISNSLIRTVSFSENFAYVLNELSLTEATFLHAARFFTDFKCKCKENYKCRHFYQLWDKVKIVR